MVRLVRDNEAGGLTFEVGAGAGRCFVKWAPAASGIDLSTEAARLTWAAPFTPVPRLLSQGSDAAGSRIVTAALPGGNAIAGRWKAAPRTAVTAIGKGLRTMHEALPVRPARRHPAGRSAGRLPRRQLRAEHPADQRWPLVRACGPRRARHR
jgi:kanamycin kinase